MSNSSSLFSHRKIPYISISVNIGNFFIFSNLRIKAIDAQNISILENDKMDFSLFSREVMDICNDSLKKSGYISSRIFLDRLKGLSYKEIAQKYNMTGRQVTYEQSAVYPERSPQGLSPGIYNPHVLVLLFPKIQLTESIGNKSSFPGSGTDYRCCHIRYT